MRATSFALVVALAACGETNIAAIQRLRPAGSSTRARLARVAARLPPAGIVTHRRLPLTELVPPLVLNFQEAEVNTEVLMEEQLSRPEVDLSGRLDLMLSPELHSCLLWTGPNNPLDPSVWDDHTELGRDCERAFRTRYLVVVRTVAWDIPDRVALEVFVVDLASEAVLSSFPLSLIGRSSRADVGRGPWTNESLKQLRSDAFVTARCELARKLAELPGARVSLTGGWLEGAAGDACSNASATSFRVESTSGAPVAAPAMSDTVGESPRPAPGPGRMGAFERCSEAAAPPAQSLNAVDWCNREYVPGLVSLRAGRGEVHEYAEPGGAHDTILSWLRSVSAADLDGDGVDEALVAIDQQTYVGAEQHASTRTWLGAFRWRGGHAELVASTLLPWAEALTVVNGEVRSTTRAGGELCLRLYRLTGERIEELRDSARCEPAP